MGKILVIAEKPSAGADMAKVLGIAEKKKGFMENEAYIVTWALGHLIGLKNPEEVDEKYKKWKLMDLPLPDDNGLKVLSDTRHQFDTIKKLINRPDVDLIINAGDAGREGYLIQNWIYRMAGNHKPVKVLWASSLTEEALKKAFADLKEEKEFKGLLEEAEARAVGDQKYGYNYSRLLTLTRGTQGTVLAYGRCQTPLLNLIVKRDEEINRFQSVPYFCIECSYTKGFKGQLLSVRGKPMNFLIRSDAEAAVKSLPNEGQVMQCQEEEKEDKAPPLYNLAELQSMAGKKFGYTAEQTLSVAQTLYEKYKILSYPRTDSRALSMDLYEEIEQHLESCCFGPYKGMIERIETENITADKRYFNDTKVTDHHALLPTINKNTKQIYSSLTVEEKNIFDEIVRSFIAIFYPPYQYSSAKIIVNINESLFMTTGTTIRSLGYKEVRKDAETKSNNLQILPILQEGQKITVDGYHILDKKTAPPQRYNVGNIIKVMEKNGIGTSATRADILKKLEKRGYITLEKGKYISTELGRKYIAVVPEQLKTPNLTKRFEEKLLKVNEGTLSKKEFSREIDREIIAHMKELNSIEGEKIGENKTEIGKCPACGGSIMEGRKNYYCSQYKKGCNFYIYKVIAGREIPRSEIKKLLENGSTGTIEGFNKKNGTGAFSAKLAFDDNKQVVFQFDQGSKKNKRIK